MRSTTARPGIAGRRTKPCNLETASAETLRTANSHPRFFANKQTHGPTKSALRRSRQTDARFDADSYFRKGANAQNIRARTQRRAVNRGPSRAWRNCGQRKAPRRAGRRGRAQSPLLRDQIRLYSPGSPSTMRA